MRILRRLQAKSLAFFAIAALVCGHLPAQELPLPVSAALQRAQLPLASVGIDVREIGSGQQVVGLHTGLPFNPASTMKLVTTNAALDLLGPAYTWKTHAYAVGPQIGDVLHGDLVIRGSGDPKLVLENFWLFLRQIRIRGIREIRGNLLLDRSAFGPMQYDPALFDGEPLRSYNAGPDALLLNYKALTYRFLPDEEKGVVRVMVEPPVAGYPVAAPSLSGGDCGDWRGRLRASFASDGARFDGMYPASCGEKIWHVHPYHMTNNQFFGAVFRQVWRDLGGMFDGEVKDGVAPPDARLVAQWESVSVAEVIRDINKYSNNVMARQLLLTISGETLKQPASQQGGALAIRSWLSRKGISAPELVVDNGSGLSRDGRIAAGTMARMLVAAFHSPVMPEFIASMPLAGYDGTMRRRLQESGVARHAHIKTGLLNDVRAIAGYVLAASGRRYAVAFIINHPNAVRGLEAQDELLRWIYEHG